MNSEAREESGLRDTFQTVRKACDTRGTCINLYSMPPRFEGDATSRWLSFKTPYRASEGFFWKQVPSRVPTILQGWELWGGDETRLGC